MWQIAKLQYQIAQVGCVTQGSTFFFKKSLNMAAQKNGVRAEARNVWMSPNYDKKILLQDYCLSNKISFLLLIMLEMYKTYSRSRNVKFRISRKSPTTMRNTRHSCTSVDIALPKDSQLSP